MKILRVLVLGLCAVSNAYAETSVGVSIGVYQPGVYGQITIGNYPPPPVYYPRPVVIMQSPIQEPLYLYVPPGHRRHWAKYCGRYEACGRPVYFVREQWIRERYEERRHEDDHDRGHGKRKKHKHEDD